MMKKGIFLLLIVLAACGPGEPKTVIAPWEPYDQSGWVAANAEHQSPRMRYKRIQSTFKDRNEMWADIADQIAYFGEEDYQALKPLILEQDIPTLQQHVKDGKLSYERLTQWYLFRIVKYENDQDKALNNMIGTVRRTIVVERRLGNPNTCCEIHASAPVCCNPVTTKYSTATVTMPSLLNPFSASPVDSTPLT